MTQIEKIKAEIERLKRHYEESVQEFGREGYKDNVLFEQAKLHVCDKLLNFINSLPKEEVNTVWHEASEEPVFKKADFVNQESQYVVCVEGLAFSTHIVTSLAHWRRAFKNKITKWAYVDDLLNIHKQEEVSEDLEEELNNQMDSIYPLPEEDDFDDPCYSLSNAIKKQRIGFKKGFKVGAGWQKEQMLKDAVEGEVHKMGNIAYIEEISQDAIRKALKGFADGDKVKLIIVKV